MRVQIARQGRQLPRRSHTAGFTLLEMVIYLTFSGIVVGAIVSVIMTQQRDHLRPLSPTDGDLYAMTEDSIAFRGVVGTGIQCNTDGADPATYTITNAAGDFNTARSDSLLMFMVDASAWRTMAIQSISTVAGSSYKCAWGATYSGPHKVTVVGDTTGIRVGGPVVAFERTTYALRQSGGEWFLQRQAGSGSWERVVGPLLSPGQDGLRLQYLDEGGNATSTAADVRAISVGLRGERGDPWGSTRVDSLKTIIHVRGG